LTYLGGGYLIWLGVQLLRRPPEQKPVTQTTHATLSASFGLGLLFTLGDQKAILFYFGFFPAFVPMEQLETGDILLILFLTLVTVGGAKALYAVSAARATILLRPRRQDLIRRIAASVFLVIGVYLIITTTLQWR
jgi:threonine/homoserine/homoserine lactone efflux protein